MDGDDNSTNTMALTIHHHGTPHTLHDLSPDTTLQDLTALLAETLHIPIENQKLLIAPKPGMQKAPFPPTRLDAILQRDSPKFRITLLGTPTKEIDDLNAAGINTKQQMERRAAARAAASAKTTRTARRSGGGGGGGGVLHTFSRSDVSSYTFHRLLPLSYLPNPSRSLDFLTRLRDDPGIRAAMTKHQFSVPLLTEMNPVEHTTSEGRTLGLNRNKGEVIELRLRTDAFDGYRDYRTIRNTLCHELAHCVFSEHDRDFWDLTNLIEKEVARADWRHGGRRLTEQEFYNPGDWEREQAGEDVVDERGWTGGEFVLGGLREDAVGGSNREASSSASASGVESRREILARAAEERMRKEREGGKH